MGFRRYVSLWAGLAACLFLLRQFAPAIAQERPPEFEEMYQRGLALYEAGKYAEAIPIAQQYIEVAAARYGEQHSWYATGLGYLAILYQAQNRFAEAEPLFKSALAIKEETLGPDHFEVGDALHALAELCRKQGRLPEAEPLYHRALSIAEKVLGPEHPSTGTLLDNLAEVYRAQGRHAEAEPLAKRSLAIREKASGSAQSSGGRLGADELASLRSRIHQLYQAGKYSEAIPLAEQYVERTKVLQGAERDVYGNALNTLAVVYEAQSRYVDAEALKKRALQIAEVVFGPDDAIVGQYLNNLAFNYANQGRYADAEPLYLRSVKIGENALGPHHPRLGTWLNNIAGLYLSQGRYADAEPLFARSISIAERALGPDHWEVGQTLNFLALLHMRQGRYAEAEAPFRRSLDILEKALGADHPEVAKILGNFASLYRAQARYSEAVSLNRRSLAIAEKALGPEHPDTAVRLTNLAAIYRDQGRYAEAEPLYRRAILIFEKAMGHDHPAVASSLSLLAGLLQDTNRLVEATTLSERSRAIRQKAFGPEHHIVGVSFNNLASLYQSQGRYAEAEPFYQRSLSISEKALGPDHPQVAQSLNNLGSLYFLRQDWARAVSFLDRGTAVTVRRNRLGQEFSEAAQQAHAFSALVKGAYRLAIVETARAPELAERMFETAQWAQGSEVAASLLQMAVRSAKGSSHLAEVVRERQDLVSEWRAKDKLFIASKTELPAKRKPEAEKVLANRLAAIDTRLSDIDKRLAQDFPDYAALASPAPISVTEVRGQLGADEALVLFLDTPESRPLLEETFVWVVTKSDVRWVRSDLGTVALTREVAALRCGLDTRAWDGEGVEKCTKALATSFDKTPTRGQPLPFDHALAHKLYLALFGEVQDLIKGKRLLIVPSGPLTQLPFQVLVTSPPISADNRAVAWLARDHAMTVLPAVSSLKALRRVSKPSAAARPLVGFGNPLLDGPDPSPANRARLARDKQRCQDTRSQRIAVLAGPRGSAVGVETRSGLADVSHIKMQVPLPETAEELCAVAQDVKADGRDIRLGAQATEREIKQLSASGELAKYRMVHFATHGVLAGQLDGTHEPGLILTPPDKATEEDDGYLSASEIAALKLDADWVILSACNTAAGAATSAEALSGLARAFIYAQARALLVSHWEVYSDATVKLITTAIREMTRDPKVGGAEALRRSMLALIDKGEPHEAHPAYWAPFVVVGEGGTDAAVTTGATTVTNMKKVPTTAKNQKLAPRPQEDWRVEILR